MAQYKKSPWVYFEEYDKSIIPEIIPFEVPVTPFAMYIYSRKGPSGKIVNTSYASFLNTFGRSESYDHITKKSLEYLLMKTNKKQYVVNLNKVGKQYFKVKGKVISKSESNTIYYLYGLDTENIVTDYLPLGDSKIDEFTTLSSELDTDNLPKTGEITEEMLQNLTNDFLYVEGKQNGQYLRDLGFEFTLSMSPDGIPVLEIKIYKLEPIKTKVDNSSNTNVTYTVFALGSLLERMSGYLNPDIVNENGDSLYVVDIVNKQSKYINIQIPRSAVLQLNGLLNGTLTGTDGSGVRQLYLTTPLQTIGSSYATWKTDTSDSTNGFILSTIANNLPEYPGSSEYRHPVHIPNYDYTSVLMSLDEVEDFDESLMFKYFVEGGLSKLVSSDNIVTIMSEMSEYQKTYYSVVLRDVPYNKDVKTHEQLLQHVSTSLGGETSSFVQAFYPDVIINKPEWGGYVALPPSVVAQVVIDKIDTAYGHHFPASGMVAHVDDAIDLVTKIRKSERDLLYDKNVNQISKIYSEGIFVWGNRTMYQFNSKLRSLNVRRMINFDIVQPLRTFLTGYLFKPATPGYIVEISNYLGDMARALREGGKVEELKYDVKYVPENNELVINLYIRPTGQIEFITVNLNVLPSSGGITITGTGE